MKQNLLAIFIILGFATTVFGQIQVSESTFPVVGDTLKIATDNLPENIEITAPGGNQIWDFTSLSAPFSTEFIYRDASEGNVADEVPGAKLVVEVANSGESYYNVTSNSFELMAVSGGGGFGIDLGSALHFQPPIVERRTLTFPQQDISESNLNFTFATDQLPSEILDSLNLPLLPDSLRLRVTQERIDFVDAWGTMDIPGGSYEVLRVKRTENRSIGVDALVPFIGWTDVTDLVAPFLAGFGDGTSISYSFFNNVEKEPIAVVTMNGDETAITQVTYKDNDFVSSTNIVSVNTPNIYAFPNPAIFDVRFEFANLNKGRYNLKIYNILGLTVWERKYNINGSKTVKVDLNDFQKGTYLYSLVDEKGKTIITKRLMIIRP